MRSGPKPLPFQLGMASLAAAGLVGGAGFDEGMLRDFFKGIQKYQAHPYKRAMPPLFAAWKMGQATLYRAIPVAQKYATPIVLIPSMVNKSDILDLMPGRSLVRWLAEQGFDAYLFDLGRPVEDLDQGDISSALSMRLLPALESLGKKPVHILGYCMGGLFGVAAGSVRPDLVKGLVLLATPWNFHDERGALKNRLSLMRPMAAPYMAQYGRLPESWTQALFASLDPEGTIRKFSGFASMAVDDPRAQMFVAVEDWLNEGIDLPKGVAGACIKEWYGQNRPFEGTWEILGINVSASGIKASTLVIAAKDDRIVPEDSAMAFADQRVKCDRILCPTGHIGLIAGRNAIEGVWQKLEVWLAAQQ